MGLVVMSAHELQRIEVLAQVLDGSLRTATAAHVGHQEPGWAGARSAWPLKPR